MKNKSNIYDTRHRDISNDIVFPSSLDIRQRKNGFEFEVMILFSCFYFEKLGKFCYVWLVF